MREALATQRELIQVFDNQIAQQGDQNSRTLNLLEDRITRGDEITDANSALYERLLAERERSAYLEGRADLLRTITPEQDAKLVSMATPLLKDMGIALRASASSLVVTANDNEAQPRSIMFINRQMAREVDLERVDEQATLILVRIVQYNTETGWGKIRTEIHDGLLSFNVPSDIKARLRATILREMNRQDSYAECQFVRSTRGILLRAIIRSIVDIEQVERPF